MRVLPRTHNKCLECQGKHFVIEQRTVDFYGVQYRSNFFYGKTSRS